ncbi:MAG TPA: PilX N-terminal domain-containing pilus assembly protein [Gemmatimonadaceae bacterium]|nr:PilX N-terminal domain-containing pilus assembly protein [Gemmatimonadaceae bacterium]
MIRPRKGFALAAALLVLLLVSALVTGVFVAATEETRVGIAEVERHHAFVAAESAIEMTIATFRPDTTAAIGLAGTKTIPIGDLEAPVIVYVTRLDSALYWIVADAGASPVEARASRRIGVVVKAVTAPDHSIIIDRISERSWSEIF